LSSKSFQSFSCSKKPQSFVVTFDLFSGSGEEKLDKSMFKQITMASFAFSKDDIHLPWPSNYNSIEECMEAQVLGFQNTY
jgi:hypothetical protein